MNYFNPETIQGNPDVRNALYEILYINGFNRQRIHLPMNGGVIESEPGVLSYTPPDGEITIRYIVVEPIGAFFIRNSIRSVTFGIHLIPDTSSYRVDEVEFHGIPAFSVLHSHSEWKMSWCELLQRKYVKATGIDVDNGVYVVQYTVPNNTTINRIGNCIAVPGSKRVLLMQQDRRATEITL